MKIVKGRINWMAGWANSPHLELLVDKLPPQDDLRYEHKEGVYYAELGGYVSFFYYVAPGEGYGGRGFELTMKDGSKSLLQGPWSSNACDVSRVGFGPCMDVHITDEPDAYERGYTLYAGAVLSSLVRDSLDRIEVPDFLVYPNWGERILNEEKSARFPPGTRATLVDLPDFPWRKEPPMTELARTRALFFLPAALLPDGTVWRKPE